MKAQARRAAAEKRSDRQSESREAPTTTHSGRLSYLDGWRGVAILLVLIGHFGLAMRIRALAPPSSTVAAMGVALFFALSGRLMADILFVERFPLLEFYQRRFSRIYPGLLVFVVLTYVLVRRTSLSFKPQAAALALTFLINYGQALVHSVPAIGNLWSVCIEEHAYLLLGLIAFFVRRRGVRDPAVLLFAIAGLSIADLVATSFIFYPHLAWTLMFTGWKPMRLAIAPHFAWSWSANPQQEFFLFWRTDALLAPIFLAAAAYLRLRSVRVPAWLPPSALLIGAALATGPAIAVPFGSALLALAIARIEDAPAAFLRALSTKPIMAFGMWSYSIYLWQQPFFHFAMNGTLGLLPAIALAIATGLASFYLVEQPARRRLNTRWRAAAARRAQRNIQLGSA